MICSYRIIVKTNAHTFQRFNLRCIVYIFSHWTKYVLGQGVWPLNLKFDMQRLERELNNVSKAYKSEQKN